MILSRPRITWWERYDSIDDDGDKDDDDDEDDDDDDKMERSRIIIRAQENGGFPIFP